MKNKIAACLIVGDSYHESEVKKLLGSLEDHVHGLFVSYNGLHDKFPRWSKWTSTHITWGRTKWVDDFSVARNHSFSLVPKDKYDWYMWADVDDIFRVAEDTTLDDMFDSIDDYTNGIFIKYNYAIDPNTKQVVVEQWRERFMSTRLEWRWKWPIHEVCATPLATQLARRDHCWIDHQRFSGEDRGARERNRRILTKAIEDNPDESRHVFYLAGETMAEADQEEEPERKKELVEAAIDIFTSFRLMRSSLDEDVFLATCRIAELNRMRGNYSEALNADMEAIAINPDWPDGYVGAAKSSMELGDWRRMKAFADIATRIPKPATAVSIESMNSTFTPIFLRGLANEELGEFEQALTDYRKAIKFWRPPGGQLEKRIKALEVKRKNFKETGKEQDDRKRLRGTHADRSICFYTNPLIETWHPEVLKTSGAGGAETCIMELAPRFAADGWRVSVFGTPGEYRGVYDGVEYWDSREYLAQEPFKIFVSSRSPLPFDSQINAKLTLLWMHDVNLQQHLIPYKNRPDRIVALSQWHKQHLMKLYDLDASRLEVMPNGINLDRFEVDRSNDPSNDPNFIWVSSPDRGLDTLLAMWPLIKKEFPKAKLEIYYGWVMIDKIIDQYRQAGQRHGWLELLKSRVETQLDYLGREKGGIIWKGRVPPDELAEGLYRANYWPYCTGFMETFCISAIQAQAAGVIPVTSKLAALQENIAIKANLIEGWPMNIDYQSQFLTALDNVMSDDPLSEEIRINCRQQGRKLALNHSWDNVYGKWIEMFQSLGVESRTSVIDFAVASK